MGRATRWIQRFDGERLTPMAEMAAASHVALAVSPVTVRGRFGEDRAWLAIMAIITAIEFCWWAVVWTSGFAPAPYVLTYLALAFAGLACVLSLRALTGMLAASSNWWSILAATTLIGTGASLFLPLKYAIPQIVPFWLDQPVAQAERVIFATDPWLQLDRLLGWAAVPIDCLYGLWLPLQSLFLFTVLTQPASAAKSRSLIAYVLAWFLLGVVAAILFSSAGPLFYDRVLGGTDFATLRETLQHRGAWVALGESDKMWASLASGRPSIVAGISAVPSIHVAVSVWMFLAVRRMAPALAPYALVYSIVIWVGSVQLGWHYVVDGLVGALGMLGIWVLSDKLQRHVEAFF
jgi:PAP2 superfamily